MKYYRSAQDLVNDLNNYKLFYQFNIFNSLLRKNKRYFENEEKLINLCHLFEIQYKNQLNKYLMDSY